MDKRWYALRSKPNRERHLETWLNNVDVDCWLPAVKVSPKNPRAASMRPFFPGYLFVFISPKEVASAHINWAYGAHGLVCFDGHPAPIPSSFVRALQLRLDELNMLGDRVLPHVRQGDPVRITEGPLKGYDAIFDKRLNGKERVQILLRIVGKMSRRTLVSPDILEKIG